MLLDLYGLQAGVGLYAIDYMLSKSSGALGIAPRMASTRLDLEGLEPLTVFTQHSRYGLQAGVGLYAIDYMLGRRDGALDIAPRMASTQLGLEGLGPMTVLPQQALYGTQAGVGLFAIYGTPDKNGGALAGLAPLIAPAQLDLDGTQIEGGAAGLATLLAPAELAPTTCTPRVAPHHWRRSRSCTSAARRLWTPSRASRR